MTKANYDLVILNHNSCKSIESLVQELLVILDKVGDPYLEYKLSEALLFEQNSSAILDNVTQETGKAYQEKFRELDVETELRPTLQLVAREKADTKETVEQYTCPACQHIQPKQKIADAMNTCEKCGVVGEKFKKNERKEEIYQQEKHKLEQVQNREMQDARERSQHDEERALRDDARQKLGLKSKRNYGTVLAGLGIVTVVGATAYFIADKMNQDSSAATEQTASTANTATDEATAQASVENDTALTAESVASGSIKDDAATQQPMVTIQGGNGSIVVNNGIQNNTKNTGKGGSKGNTAGEAVNTNAGSSNAVTANNQQPTDQLTSTPANTADASANTVKYTDINGSANSQQQTEQATSASQSGTQQQTNMQLAAVTPTQQNAALTQNQEAVKASTNAANSISAPTQKPKVLEGINAPANDIQQLKDILQVKHTQSSQFFSRLNKQQFTEHQQRLNRLLSLDKPDLALIFAEGIDDPYLASLLILEVGKYAKKKSNNELNDAILLGMKAQVAKGSSVTNNAMLNASLSQAYDFAGDKDSAREILKQSVQMLNHEDISVDQSCKLLTQIDQNHRQFGNQNGADFMAGTLIEFANKLPAKDYRYRSEIYTHLAATALRDGNKEDATEWLKHIPVQNAQRELLSELETILAKNKFSKTH